MAAAEGAVAPGEVPTVRCFVSGFGKFVGVEVNPTSELATLLPAMLLSSEGTKYQHVDLVDSRVVHVSQKGVDTMLDEFEALEAEHPGPSVFLHFGVAMLSLQPALEQFGYNKTHFLVPDEA
jgi:hypothetical protein